MYRLLLKFIGFAGVGGIMTLLSMALIAIFNEYLHFNPEISYIVSYVATLILSYWLNSKYVFASKPGWYKLLGYCCIYLCGMGLGLVILQLLIGILPSWNCTFLSYLTIPITMLWNFCGTHLFLSFCDHGKDSLNKGKQLIEKYSLDRLFLMFILSFGLWYAHFHDVMFISCLLNTSHDITFSVAGMRAGGNQNFTIKASNSPKELQYLVFPVKKSSALKPMGLVWKTASNCEWSLHVLQLSSLTGDNYEWVHGEILKAFNSSVNPLTVNSKYGVTIIGSSIMTLQEKNISSVPHMKIDIPKTIFSCFRNTSSLTIFVLLQFAIIAAALSYRRIILWLRNLLGLYSSTRGLLIGTGIFIFSSAIFIYFLSENMNKIYGDEGGYIAIAEYFNHERPPLYSSLKLRTYGYPMILASISAFCDVLGLKYIFSDSVKIAVCVFQFLLLQATLVYGIYVSRKFWKNTIPSWWFFLSYAIIALNPWLIQSCTLYLSDLTGACFIAIPFFILWHFSEEQSFAPVVIAMAFLACGSMIRPVNLLFFGPALIACCIYSFTSKCRRRDFLHAFLFPIACGVLVSFCIFLPQLMLNSTLKQTPQFPIIANLMKSQTEYGTSMLKYATRVLPPPTVGLRFVNPGWEQYGNAKSYKEKSPFHYYFSKFVHIPAAILQGENFSFDTYVKAGSPILVSLCLGPYLLYWSIVIAGTIMLIANFRKLKNEVRIPLATFGIAIFSYLLFLCNTAVESRFIYSAFLLSGVVFIGSYSVFRISGRIQRLFTVILCASMFVGFYVIFFWLETLCKI